MSVAQDLSQYIIPDPSVGQFNNAQRTFLQHYVELRTKNATREEQLKALTEFYEYLNREQQIFIKNWYTQQLCMVDPTMVASMCMSQFLHQHNLEKSIAISHDGQSFLLLLNNPEEAEEVISKLKVTHPYVYCDSVKVETAPW